MRFLMVEWRKNPAGIKCILYDVGQTLVICHNTLISQRLGRLAGKNKEEVQKLIVGRGELVDQACEGKMNDEEYIARLRKVLGIDGTISTALILEACKNYTDFSGKLRRILHFLRDSAEDGIFVQGIVSNIFGIHWHDIVSRYPTLRLRHETQAGVMDFHMLSYQACVAKPNPRFYAAAFHKARMAASRLRLGELKPHECLFFDDLPENVAAAESFGMVACLAEGSPFGHWNGRDAAESIERHLRELGIGLPPESYVPPCDKIPMEIIKPYDPSEQPEIQPGEE